MSTLGELGKALGEEWRTMGDEAKAEWNTKAEADKARYEAELAIFRAEHGETEADRKRREKAEAGGKPRKPRKPREGGEPRKRSSGGGAASAAAAARLMGDSLNTLSEIEGESARTWWNQKAGTKSASPGHKWTRCGGGSAAAFGWRDKSGASTST